MWISNQLEVIWSSEELRPEFACCDFSERGNTHVTVASQKYFPKDSHTTISRLKFGLNNCRTECVKEFFVQCMSGFILHLKVKWNFIACFYIIKMKTNVDQRIVHLTFQ